MISRRFFLAGLGASLIAPQFVETALNHFERTGLPLLPPSPTATTVLYAAVDSEDDNVYRLWDKTPQQHRALFNSRPRSLRWREYLEWRGQQMSEWDLTESYLDEPIPEFQLFDDWILRIDPFSGPHDLISGLRNDLGVELVGDSKQCGHIGFGCWMDYQDVHVSDELGLSCLQHRLNTLGTGIRIELAEEVDPMTYV